MTVDTVCWIQLSLLGKRACHRNVVAVAVVVAVVVRRRSSPTRWPQSSRVKVPAAWCKQARTTTARVTTPPADRNVRQQATCLTPNYGERHTASIEDGLQLSRGTARHSRRSAYVIAQLSPPCYVGYLNCLSRPEAPCAVVAGCARS